jgi:hypothetical protein
VRFRLPSSLDEAVQVAITVSNAERVKQVDTKGVFSAKRDGGSQAIVCFNCGKRGHYAKDCRTKGKDGYPEGNGRARQVAGSRRFGAPDYVLSNSSTPGTPKGKVIRCFNCNKLGHRRDQCPQLVGNNHTKSPPNSRGSATRSPKSTQVPSTSPQVWCSDRTAVLGRRGESEPR